MKWTYDFERIERHSDRYPTPALRVTTLGCFPDTPPMHIATIIEPDNPNPGLLLETPLGINAVREVLEAFSFLEPGEPAGTIDRITTDYLRRRFPTMTRLSAASVLLAMGRVGMLDYPPVSGDPSGVTASGDAECAKCGKRYREHPLDWRLIGYGDVPFLHVLCDGSRVKL